MENFDDQIKQRQDLARQQGWSEDEIARGTMVEMAKNKLSSVGQQIKDVAAPVVDFGKKLLTRPPGEFGPLDPGSLYGGFQEAQKAEDGQTKFAQDMAMQFIGGVKQVPSAPTAPVFQGLKDLTTKVLEKLKGKSVVSRQFISDLTNMPELRQPERDLIRKVIDEYKGKSVGVKEFANKVKTELLPLERTPRGGFEVISGKARLIEPGTPRYENITLPPNLRGQISTYNEHIYQSPIKTSAGNIHWGAGGFLGGEKVENYFAHTRVEDLPPTTYNVSQPGSTTDKVRRVIELQSDLFQKGRLEKEISDKEAGWILRNISGISKDFNISRNKVVGFVRKLAEDNPDKFDKLREKYFNKEISIYKPLEPYRNTWHERVIREEIKKAAQDGKTKLQFPTGETAMKIEGLGRTDTFSIVGKPGLLKPDDLKVGLEIKQGGYFSRPVVVTNIIGDGKFEAVPKDVWQSHQLEIGGKFVNKMPEIKSQLEETLKLFKEKFDISGKVDTSNPIYKFYEKVVQKYLNRIAPDTKMIIDPQGVQWFELNVKPEAAKLPIEAFGVAGAVGLNEIMKRKAEETNQQDQPSGQPYQTLFNRANL